MPFLHNSLNEKNGACSDLIDEPPMNTLPLAMIAWSKKYVPLLSRPKNISVFFIFA